MGHLASRPRAARVPPAARNLPRGKLWGALFHGLSHVLRGGFPQVSPALYKVPKRATNGPGCAVNAQNTMDTLATPNNTDETHSPRATIALPKVPKVTANRSLHTQ